MNEYIKWVNDNRYNPNRSHSQKWVDDETIEISAYDEETHEGVKATFKMSNCEKENACNKCQREMSLKEAVDKLRSSEGNSLIFWVTDGYLNTGMKIDGKVGVAEFDGAYCPACGRKLR